MNLYRGRAAQMTKIRKMGWISDTSRSKAGTYEILKDTEKDFFLGCDSVGTYLSVYVAGGK